MAFSASHQEQMRAEMEAAGQNTEHIRHQILVMSGKGGVGKSTVAANVAVWLSMEGKRVGLLDVDIDGPSVPKLLGLEGRRLTNGHRGIEPIAFSESLHVMSVGFVIGDENEAVIWRGPMKHQLIRQFVCEVRWGELDYLIVDCPPGTGDEPLSIVHLLQKAKGAVVVTTPNEPGGDGRTEMYDVLPATEPAGAGDHRKYGRLCLSALQSEGGGVPGRWRKAPGG
jgi:ATP-binding protein involved in chromosome partitioning